MRLMKWIDLLHRWAGGTIGLILAILGLTGAILVHRDAWVALPHAGDAQVQDVRVLADVTQKIMAAPATRPESILFASQDFGLHRLSFKKGAGAYVDQTGAQVAHWDSQWERPELWLFDLHHHLFTGDVGETVIGIAAVAGFILCITGAILWWRTRKTYEFRLLPARLTRPSIVRHHRDLGIIVAPLLILSLVTGAVLVFRPLAIIFGPGAPAQIKTSLAAPEPIDAKLDDRFDWKAMIERAHARFPEAQIRLVSLPRKDSGLVTVRMRGPQEWLPNGRTTIWFAADTGAVVRTRDAETLPMAARAFNALYPLHAAKIGGLAFRLVMTVSGLALAMLGSFAVWTFWFKRPKKKPRVRNQVGQRYARQ
jgi:uncharacterized iron-regulated membrane protein